MITLVKSGSTEEGVGIDLTSRTFVGIIEINTVVMLAKPLLDLESEDKSLLRAERTVLVTLNSR
jgi:hypothetical protein